MFRLSIAALLIGLSLATPSRAQDHRATLVKIARDFIVPRYEALAEAAKAQQDAWNAFCASPREDSFGSLQAAYQKAADAWSGIEFVLYGPISVDFRFERMAHWPERKNAVGRSLNNLLSRTGTDDLTPERFAQVSAAVQGLTAVERLLYERDAAHAVANGSDSAKRRCAVGQAVAAALARTSAQVLDEWRRPDGTLAKLDASDAAGIEEAGTRLATDYITLFEIIDDQKLGSVMGKDPDDVHATLAEGWRSGRSMQAIKVNLEAADALARLLADPSKEENASLFYALKTARSIAETLPANIGDAAADPKQRRNIVFLRDAVHSLREVAEMSVPDALGVTIGFNSRDGD